MRPRKLEITAFGPFAGSEMVDFDVLAEAGLFLVSGPTGAGKTSLLDAISYALYGSVPGGRRPDRLRSDHAPATLDTQVALEFTLGRDDWRVTRKPPHERAKRRGGGTTLQKPTATLSRRTGAGWEPLCSGVEEVGRTVAETLGLNAQQFMQVVVLPQGEVQRALRADAREREQLLSALFHTGRFSQVADHLAQRARTLGAEVTRRVERLEHLRSEAAQRWREVAKELDDAGDLDEAPVGQEELDRLAEQAAAARAAVREEADKARERAERAARALRVGELLASRWRRRRQAQTLLARLDAEAGTIASVRQRLALAEAAAPCQSLLTALDAALTAHRETVEVRNRVLARVGDPAESLEVLDPTLAGTLTRWPQEPPAHQDVDEARRRLGGLRVRVDEATARHDAMRQALQQAEDHRRRAQDAEQAADAASWRAVTLEAEAAEAAEALQQAQEAARRLPGEEAEAARLRRAANAAAEVLLLQERWEDAREAALTAAQAAQAAEAERLDLLRWRIEGMAGELAAGLQPGQPCPVCGAEDHPHPAERTHAVDPADIEAADAAAADLQRAAEEACAAREAVGRELEVVRATAGGQDADPVQAACQAEDAETEARRTATVAALVDQHATRLADLRRRLKAAQEDAARLRAEAAADQARAVTWECRADEEKTLLVAASGSAGDPREEAGRLGALERELNAVGAAVQALDRTERDLRGCEHRAAEVAGQQGFADLAAVRRSLLGDAEQEQLRQRVEEHAAGRALAEGTLADAEIAGLDGAAEPDVQALEDAAESAARNAEAATERQATVVRAADELRRLAAQHADQQQALVPLQNRANRVRHLAEACNGTGNALRMSLERYVLAAFLEDITARASLRLAAMSDGRYTLRHSDERVKGNAASGLSILVQDAFTGIEREVGSLSGGETFQASLALALGIADAVQSHSAGLRLDTLFIDEGFGALDPEALEQAMAELDRLREGGRLVGVISHVAALQERIPTGSRVLRTRTGSHVEVHTGQG